MRHVLVPALLLTAAAACHRGHPPAPAPTYTPVHGMSQVYYDNSGGISDSVQIVVRDASTLQIIWKQAVSRQSTPPAPPSVDFTRNMLLVVGAGRQTPDDRVIIDSATVQRPAPGSKGEPTLTVYSRIVEGCHRFQADAYPVEIVRVPRFEGPVRFEAKREKPMDCT